MSGAEFQFHLSKFMLLGVCLAGAAMVGLLLAGAPFLLVLSLGGVTWLLTLPYHSTLALVLSIVTFNSALIIPSVPGRPFVWELAAGLGWSGLLVCLALRKFEPGVDERFRRNKLLFFGILGYLLVLAVLIYYRGIGIRVLGLGSDLRQMGGRLYVQQIVCAIFPFLLLLNPLSEKLLVRLFVIQCALSVTFVISDLAFSYSRGFLYYLLLFLELPGDGVNFEMQDIAFGLRRFQSLFLVSLGMLCLLWVWRPMSDYAKRPAIWLFPLTGALFGIGLLGGHRALVLLVMIALAVCLWAQRFFTVQRLLILFFLASFSYLFLKVYVRELPLAAQRALSPVPGMEVDRLARDDGDATMEGRRTLRKAGWEAAQEYLWLGRGFGKIQDANVYEYRYDMAYYFVDNGIFFNGTIGLLVNTGVPGTIFFFMVLAGGTMTMVRILQFLRREGAEDPFVRMSCVLAGLWAAQVSSFIFLHGDSEYALRTFSLPAAMMLACDWHLSRRPKGTEHDVPVAVVDRRRPLYMINANPRPGI